MPARRPTDATLDRAIGNRIQLARRKLRWTQAELSVRLGLQSETVSRYETGTVPVSLTMLFQIAAELETSVEALLGLASRESRFSAEEIELVDWWRNFDPDVRRLLLELLRKVGRSTARVTGQPRTLHEKPVGPYGRGNKK